MYKYFQWGTKTIRLGNDIGLHRLHLAGEQGFLPGSGSLDDVTRNDDVGLFDLLNFGNCRVNRCLSKTGRNQPHPNQSHPIAFFTFRLRAGGESEAGSKEPQWTAT